MVNCNTIHSTPNLVGVMSFWCLIEDAITPFWCPIRIGLTNRKP